MKKLKTIACALLLSAMLVGNVFATGSSGAAVWSFLTYAVDGVAAFFSGGGSCPIRQCTHCRPSEEPDEDGNCRPTQR